MRYPGDMEPEGQGISFYDSKRCSESDFSSVLGHDKDDEIEDDLDDNFSDLEDLKDEDFED